MPNIKGPKSGKRAVLSSVIHNSLLYGAPIWKDALETRKNITILERVQRNILLRVASAYRTVSGTALQVVTGTLPIDLAVHERAEVHRHQGGGKEARSVARQNALNAWQRRWDSEGTKAQWTKRLIRDVAAWVQCGHREVDYYLTQALTAHGTFRAYAKRFGKDTEEACIYCEELDTAEHTIFSCHRWNSIRLPVYKETGCITPDTMVQRMLESREMWENIHGMVKAIIKVKESDEYRRAGKGAGCTKRDGLGSKIEDNSALTDVDAMAVPAVQRSERGFFSG